MKNFFTITIALFTLSLSAQTKDIDASATPKKAIIKCPSCNLPSPLIIINDVVIKDEKVGSFILNNINQEQIELLNVLKGEEVIKEYGEDAKGGVIKLKLKENKKDATNFSSSKEEMNPLTEVVYFTDSEGDKARVFLEVMKQNSNKINEVSFLKGEEAIKKYGEEAKNGVVLVSLTR